MQKQLILFFLLIILCSCGKTPISTPAKKGYTKKNIKSFTKTSSLVVKKTENFSPVETDSTQLVEDSSLTFGDYRLVALPESNEGPYIVPLEIYYKDELIHEDTVSLNNVYYRKSLPELLVISEYDNYAGQGFYGFTVIDLKNRKFL